MRKHLLICIFFMISLLVHGATSLRMYSDETITIDSPVDDDIFAAGSVVNINAPVDSAVVAGGVVTVNAPIAGDLILAGGQVVLRSDIGGKLVAAGSRINISSKIQRNAVLMGEDISMLPGTTVGRDALIGAKRFSNQGSINGTLTVAAEQFENNGTAGRVEFQRIESRHEDTAFMSFFHLLSIIGYLLLGLIGLRVAPWLFRSSEDKMLRDPAIETLVGFLAIIVSLILAMILAITIVGIPVSVMLLLLLGVGIMLSCLLVSFTLGRKVMAIFRSGTGSAVSFTVGYVILNILFLLPYIGWIFMLIAVCMGVGALLYVMKDGASTTQAATA
ncbi:conserved hypothetical protein [Methanothrix thermoacetophila PT]|uniref:DUF8173 domain-containing protein n=2 Tax=Methanotrichaceae TaxID=143067 RepID=A0B8P6_METTP|nr:conserved hypothetical protein [Methanothrix thermoacetophila PT]